MKKYILELLILVNRYYPYDTQYVKNKYKINDDQEFNRIFEKNEDILLFNSLQSEILFIHILNVDNDYIYKYKKSLHDLLSDYFVNRKKCHFSRCHKVSSKTKTSHLDNCYCKIKVKSVANIKIDTFIEIYKNEMTNPKVYINKIDVIKNYVESIKKLSQDIKKNKTNVVKPPPVQIDETKPNIDFQFESEIDPDLKDFFDVLIGIKPKMKIQEKKINKTPVSSIDDESPVKPTIIENKSIKEMEITPIKNVIIAKEENAIESSEKSITSYIKTPKKESIKNKTITNSIKTQNTPVKKILKKDKSESDNVNDFIKKETTENSFNPNTEEMDSIKSNSIFRKNEKDLLIKNKDDEIKKKKMIMLLKMNQK